MVNWLYVTLEGGEVLAVGINIKFTMRLGLKRGEEEGWDLSTNIGREEAATIGGHSDSSCIVSTHIFTATGQVVLVVVFVPSQLYSLRGLQFMKSRIKKEL